MVDTVGLLEPLTHAVLYDFDLTAFVWTDQFY